MKRAYVFLILLFYLFSCKEQKPDTPSPKKNDVIQNEDLPVFFPVTNYIRGQIFDIKQSGINPLRIAKNSHGTLDSSWIKMESLYSAFAEFLSPEIDTINLVGLFAEKKFFDQSLDAITLTYDPVGRLPDSFSLKHWDIYIDPNNNAIKRIYLLKKISAKQNQQLTWLSDKWCRIVTIEEDSPGNSIIKKEVTYKWDL